MAQGDMTITASSRLWIDGGIFVAIIGMAFYVGAWKTQQEEDSVALQRQIEELSQQVSALAARPITSEADRRLSVAEAQLAAQALTITEFKVDIAKRFDRLDGQNDLILRELRARR